MSENPFTDGQQFSAARLNSMYNAHQNEGVLNGLDASTSTNAFDVDVASGELFLNDDVVSVGSATLSLSTSDPEDRIDLISADSTGLTVTQGNPAATSGQPIAPDIPSGDVLVSLIYVRGGSSEILTGDIFNDYRVSVDFTPPDFISPQGENSGLDADTVRGSDPVESVNGRVGDVSFIEFENTTDSDSVSVSASNQNDIVGDPVPSQQLNIGALNTIFVSGSISGNQIEVGSISSSVVLQDSNGNDLINKTLVSNDTSSFSGSYSERLTLAAPVTGTATLSLSTGGSNYDLDNAELSADVVYRDFK